MACLLTVLVCCHLRVALVHLELSSSSSWERVWELDAWSGSYSLDGLHVRFVTDGCVWDASDCLRGRRRASMGGTR